MRKRRTTRRRSAATTRRRRSTATPRRRRRNSTRIVVRNRRRRRANPIRRRRTTRRRSNPSLFGSRVSTTQLGQAIVGGLIGVTAAKLIPAALPANLTATPIMRMVATGFSAWAAGWAAGQFSQPFGHAVLFGGLMQVGSILLNSFLPSVGGYIALQGLGELVHGAYPVPQNPLNPMQANYPAYGRPLPPGGEYGNGAPVAMNGLNRAFGRAF